MNYIDAYLSDGNNLINIIQSLDDGTNLQWAILGLEVIGNKNFNVLDLEKEINSASNIYYIKWEELCLFIEKIDQIIDVLIVGSDLKGEEIKRYDSISDYYKYYKHVITLEDGNILEISTYDDEWFKKLQQMLATYN